MPALLRQALVLLATLAMIAANAFPGARGYRGETVGSISDAYPTLLTPAGYAFAIWSLIYLGLLVFSVVQLLPSRRDDPLLRKIAPWYVATCVLNGAWIFVWLSRWFWLSLAVIAGLLAGLMRIYLLLDADRATRTGPERWGVAWPFSLYAAWVTVATVLNATVALRATGFQGAGLAPGAWATVLIVLLLGLVGVIATPRRDPIFTGVAVWALAALAVARLGSGSAPAVAVAVVAALAAGILVWLTGVLAWRAARSRSGG
jgi:hypothetical protein